MQLLLGLQSQNCCKAGAHIQSPLYCSFELTSLLFKFPVLNSKRRRGHQCSATVFPLAGNTAHSRCFLNSTCCRKRERIILYSAYIVSRRYDVTIQIWGAKAWRSLHGQAYRTGSNDQIIVVFANVPTGI